MKVTLWASGIVCVVEHRVVGIVRVGGGMQCNFVSVYGYVRIVAMSRLVYVHVSEL